MKQMGVAAAMTLPAGAWAQNAGAQGLPRSASTAFFNVLDFGAVAGGKTVCTPALQKAVDTCSQAGGGTIVVPAGKYLTGPIFLKSNINFEILPGATLLFTTDISSVPSVSGRWEGIDRTVYASLFTGIDLENVSITGRGTLDGQGEAWWNAFRIVSDLRRKLGLNEREPENPPGSPLQWSRPCLINLYRCKNVFISGLRIVDSPSWNIHPVLCENLLIDGVTITAPDTSPNTDGIDPDSCKNVRIANCAISVGDDCIIIKSGYRYRSGGVPCEDISVTNCVFGRGHAGIGVGSETAGGVRNVTISNCICDGTDRGLRFKTARGRGNVVENVRASNFVMRHVGEPVIVTMFYTGGDMHTPQPVDQYTPTFRNFHFSEIVASGARRVAVIEGLPERAIEGLSISNLVAEGAAAGIACTNATGVIFDNVVVNAERGPALFADNVRQLEILRLATRQPNRAEPVIRLEKVDDAVVQSCIAAEGTGTFLELRGAENRDISLITNRLTRASREVSFVGGAAESAIVKRI